MWIMLNDAFFSIVAKDCARDELMVRARRPGDIEKVFPEAKGKVTEFTASDYHYRCAIKRDTIKRAMVGEIDRIGYSNFKGSVTDKPLHDAYMRVWSAMADLQPQPPYAGRGRPMFERIGIPVEDAVAMATGFLDDADFGPQDGDTVTFAGDPVKHTLRKPKTRKPAKKNTRGR